MRAPLLWLYKFNIEIFLVILVLGFGMLIPTYSPAKLNKIEDSYKNQSLQMNSKQADDYFQRRMVEWENYHKAIWIPLVTLTTACLGAWGDIHGRQINILLGMAALVVDLNGYQLMWSDSTDWPLWTGLIFVFISAMVGSFEVSFVSLRAYMADAVADKDQLTIRLTIIEVLESIAFIIASLIAAFFAHRFHLATWMLFCNIIIALSFFYAVFFIPQVSPMLILRSREARRRSLSLEAVAPVEPKSSFSPWRVIRQRFALAWLSIKTLFKQRDGGKRKILIVLIFMRFLQYIAGLERSDLFGFYTVRKRFHWTSVEFGYYNAIKTFISAIGLAAGIFLLKKVLKLSDTMIIVLAQISNILAVIVLIFATKSWHFYLSPVVGILSNAAYPVMASYVTRLVGADEVGKTYTFFALMLNVSLFFQQYVLQNVYAWTVSFFPQLVWVIICAMYVLGLLLMIYVHILSKRMRIEDKTVATVAGDIGKVN